MTKLETRYNKVTVTVHLSSMHILLDDFPNGKNVVGIEKQPVSDMICRIAFFLLLPTTK